MPQPYTVQLWGKVSKKEKATISSLELCLIVSSYFIMLRRVCSCFAGSGLVFTSGEAIVKQIGSTWPHIQTKTLDTNVTPWDGMPTGPGNTLGIKLHS